MTSARAVRPQVLPELVRLALCFAALAYVIGCIAILAGETGKMTSYAAEGPGSATATLSAGIGLIAVGCAAWLARPGGWLGLVATLLGTVWLTQIWVGWSTGPGIARSLGMLGAPFIVALLTHLALAFPGGQRAYAGARHIVRAGYVAATTVAVAVVLFYNPFLDPDCWSNCSDNVFVLRSDPELTSIIRRVGLPFSALVGALLATATAARLVMVSPAGRRALLPVLAPVAVAGAAEAAYSVALLQASPEDPERTLFLTIFIVRATTLTILALGLAWALLRDHRRRTAVARLADQSGEARHQVLRDRLAASLRDDAVAVAYWLPDSSQFVDAGGAIVEPQPGRGQVATRVLRNGETVAVVLHDHALTAGVDLEREIGSAARLVLDNERLQAALLAQLEDLRSARARIVETSDNTRRDLERDLHDGAQQRLLAIALELRMAHTAVSSTSDEEFAATLASAVNEAQAAILELRDVAHGIFPAVLEQAGLGTALYQLADLAPVAVYVADVPEHRLPADVERAVYLLVGTALSADTGGRADLVQLSVVHRDRRVVVDVEGVGVADYTHLADRVGALGGRLDSTDRRLRAEIPCA